MKSNKIVIRWILISNEEKGRLKPFLDLLHSFCNDLYRNHFHVKEPRLIREFLSLSMRNIDVFFSLRQPIFAMYFS